MPTDAGQRATSRRREGAKHRRERRLRAEARIRLQLCRDAARIALHRGGDGFRAREEVERVQYFGLRAQKPPLPGLRPAPLAEVPVPQERLEAPARVSDGAPSLAPPALADAAAEAVDRRALAFLTRRALLQREEEAAVEELEEDVEEEDESAHEALPPRLFGTVYGTGIIRGDDGSSYTFRANLLLLQVGWRVAFRVCGPHERNAYDVTIWKF